MSTYKDNVKYLKVDFINATIYFPVYYPLSLLSKKYEKFTPNIITILGLLAFISLLITSIILKDTKCLALGLYVFAGADIADGFVARKFKKSSKIGAVLDLFSDRLVFITMSVSVIFLSIQGGEDTLHISLFAIYTTLFLYFDSLTLIRKDIFEIYGLKEGGSIKSNEPNFLVFLTRFDFRFSSYIPMIFWFVSGNLTWLIISIMVVLLSYVNLAWVVQKYLKRMRKNK